MSDTQDHSLGQRAKSWAFTAWNWTLRYPLALVIATLVVVVAVVLLVLGFGDAFNVGGVLGWLFGRDEADEEPGLDVKFNRVPEGRDRDGEPIEVGEPDDEGFAQREVKVIDRKRNPFRDRSVIEVEDPDVPGETRKLRLPTGVSDTDVDTVILTRPGEVEVRVVEGPERASGGLRDALK